MSNVATLELKGPQFRLLGQALRARLSLKQFDMMLKQRLDVERPNITLADNYEAMVFDVIVEANRGGWVFKLVEAAREERPDEPVFVEYAQIVGIGPGGLPDKAELERIIRVSNTLFDIARFRSRIGEIEGQVCRVDLLGEGTGTGFLVDPDKVLTNYHVIESVFVNGQDVTDYSCRFDFKVREDGQVVQQGMTVAVKQLLYYSPYDPADLNMSSKPPDPGNLDYALMLLDGAPGNEPVGGITIDEETPPRKWVALPTAVYDFAPATPLFIVQHPKKRPMKLALDTDSIINLNTNHTRVRYRTNTESGSSGSPCFNQNWELVALHHSGDPNWISTWNQGIPIQLITKHLNQAGFKQEPVD
jgi:hypothetical protein